MVADFQPKHSASLGGGEQVVITGRGFTGATTVEFGTFEPPSFRVDSDTQITAIAPAATLADASVVQRPGLATVDRGFCGQRFRE